MNRLPINPASDKKFMECCRSYCMRLLARADLHARLRDGDSIETGDFDRAAEDIENRGSNTQILLTLGGASIGAGVSGLVQNGLDGKSSNYTLAFLAVLVLGVCFAYAAISRK